MLLKAFGLGRPSRQHPDRVGPVQAKILSFIATQPEQSHGVGIARHLRAIFDPDLTDAQAYVALKRLEARGLVSSVTASKDKQETTPSKRSRGRPHKYYSLTPSGMRALSNVGDKYSRLNPDGLGKGNSNDHQTSPTPVVG
jgi:DNA-binding PadR family transcriptional regulator